MWACPLSSDEEARLSELAGQRILGTAPEARFDHIVALASELFGVPVAYISFVGREQQWLKARVGIDFDQTARASSFCGQAILSDAVLVVPDARKDPRFATSPMVQAGPKIRFYAGAPLIAPSGRRLGSLCIADSKPHRGFSDKQRQVLRRLAALVVDQLEHRRLELMMSTALGFAAATQEVLMAADEHGTIIFSNPTAQKLFGYEEAELLGKSFDQIIPERLRAEQRAGLMRAVGHDPRKLAGRRFEVMAQRKDGTEFPIEASLCSWSDERGIGVGAILRDISERRQRDAHLLRLAHHDALTGLPNKAKLTEQLAQHITVGLPASVLLLDLDGFKEVNDSHGHATGDTLLQVLAVRLPGFIEEGAMVARFGGDEFAVLLQCADPATVAECAASLQSALAVPFTVGGHAIYLAAGIGAAVAPTDGASAGELIASADLALSHAKSGGPRFRLFERTMRNEVAARRALQDDLRRGFEAGELVMYYQPQITLVDGRIFGVEALLRWRHPERGLLLPGAFLPALTSRSLALQLGRWTLEETCRQAAEWRALGLAPLRMSVNLFAAQFQAGTLGRTVKDVLARTGLEPELLELEVTEKIALQHDDTALAAISELRDHGVRIAFDDFGTGYASLSTLQRFPLTTLKIDRSFVRDLLTNAGDAAIVKAIVMMGQSLGLEVIAEGIETAEQDVTLRRLGCEAGQGYRYGRPMEPAALTQILSGQTVLAA
jgi:diguanylate cyclase (GGDEF)-like protein/PAS domain S-box-containing protein